MITKEKAEELIKKFEGLVYPYMGSSMLVNETDDGVIRTNAKTCALICVSEIIKELDDLYTRETEIRIKFWASVKLELEKL